MSETDATRDDARRQNLKVAYHEAAHAVVFWNLGLGVQQIWLDRVRHCGHAQRLRQKKDRSGRMANAIACVAGLAAQVFLEPDLPAEDVHRSFRDFELALVDFLPPGELTDGEQLGVALALTKRVSVLLREAEVRRQIQTLVPPLLAQGCLLEHQVDRLLRRLSESPTARRKCSAFVALLEAERCGVVDGARGFAPGFRWVGAREDDG